MLRDKNRIVICSFCLEAIVYQKLISVIFTTYNSIDWLEKVLWGFHHQTDKNFEVIIADDGSKEDTRIAIENFAQHSHLDIQHVWQPDEGFQKCKIMNKALKKHLVTT